jgi:Uma2 family endonuclease
MSAPSVVSRAALPPPGLPIYFFTPEQFQQLIASEVLSPDVNVELHDGQVFIRNNGTLPPLRFTVEQYQRMITLGILSEDAPVELLEGWLVTKMALNPPHDTTIYRTQMALLRRLPPDWICRGQSGVTTDDSQPEPDLAVVRGPIDRYDDHHPTAEETALVVEVANSSLQQDRNFKGRLYARAGIAVYWIVNLIEDQVEVYSHPASTEQESAFRRREDYRQSDSIPLIVGGNELTPILVQDLLPRREDQGS